MQMTFLQIAICGWLPYAKHVLVAVKTRIFFPFNFHPRFFTNVHILSHFSVFPLFQNRTWTDRRKKKDIKWHVLVFFLAFKWHSVGMTLLFIPPPVIKQWQFFLPNSLFVSPFLVADTQLYKSLYPLCQRTDRRTDGPTSVHRSVGPYVGPSLDTSRRVGKRAFWKLFIWNEEPHSFKSFIYL